MRSKQGTVISDTSDKTIVIKVDRAVRHPIYKKNYRVSKKFHAHDEKNEAQVGDVVEIVESKPISKKKTWKLEKILSKNARVVDQPAAVESDSEKELKESVAKEKTAPKVEVKKEEKIKNSENSSEIEKKVKKGEVEDSENSEEKSKS
ncbi:30S ribosomal protein S17 [Candidatus Gracilibacteria bacterium]|nr:30S ribosomal protein S17 [Candidatus Gracilibacteria bacterium]